MAKFLPLQIVVLSFPWPCKIIFLKEKIIIITTYNPNKFFRNWKWKWWDWKVVFGGVRKRDWKVVFDGIFIRLKKKEEKRVVAAKTQVRKNGIFYIFVLKDSNTLHSLSLPCSSSTHIPSSCNSFFWIWILSLSITICSSFLLLFSFFFNSWWWW